MKLGIKHHDKFASVNSHSGAVGIMHDPDRIKGLGDEFARVFGKAPTDGPEDPFALVKSVDHGRLPAMRLDCGMDDFLLAQNRSFHKHLNDLHVPHDYEEFPGGHDWAYWDRHVQEAISFHAKNLHLKK